MNSTYKKIEAETADIHGWLTKSEGRLLYRTAVNLEVRGPIVEIGSWCGKSTVWLGNAVKDSDADRAIYAVDPHTGAPEQQERYGEVWTLPKFKENIQNAGVGDLIEPLVMTSEEAAEKIEENPAFVFIDGAHEYEMVLLDFNLWAPRIPEGGKIAFHDTMGRTGPTRVARNNIYFSSRFKEIKRADSITLATKTDKLTFSEWIAKIIAYLRWEIVLTFSYRIPHYWGIFKWHSFRKWKKKYFSE